MKRYFIPLIIALAVGAVIVTINIILTKAGM